MIIINEFVWNQDHYVYHLTEKEAMPNIIVEGLKPKCGVRSQLVGDIRKAVYFFDSLSKTENWLEYLYANKDLKGLELLRFNLKQRRWKIQCSQVEDFYLLNPVLPQGIDYATLYDERGQIVTLDNDFSKVKILWKPLSKYEQR